MNLNIPNHLAIIMDGNGRWATKRGLGRSRGHLKGSDVLLEIAEYSFDKGIKVLSVFAFSTENFNRSKDEVNFIMELGIRLLKEKLDKLINNNIKVVFSGRRAKIPTRLLKLMDKVEKETINNDRAILNICLNYGGRSEIIDAVKTIIKSNIDIETLNENAFQNYLYNNLPDIDLVIRTSGEYRISNFMLYQMSYAELYFTGIYWPDFTTKEIDKAILEFSNRNRRFGGS